MAAGSESDPGARRPWRRRALGAALLVVAAVLAWRLAPRGAPDRAESVARAAAAAEARPALPPITRSEPSSATADQESPPARPPIIDGIDFEKDAVCEGEENLVTVRAHTEDGRDDAFLHATIAGTPGTSVPVRATRGTDGTQPARFVTVFGRDNVPVTVALPDMNIQDCTATRYLLVDHRLRPNTEAELELRARLVELEPGTKPAPDHWAWDFGDGTTLETATPYAVHDYGGRPQDRLYSQFVVRVEAVAPGGERVLGRTTLALRNAAFTNLVYAGVVSLMVELEPRFPALDADGVVRQRVRVWHHQHEPVRIQRVTSRRNYADERRPETSDASVTGLLGTALVPPSGITTRVSLDTRREPGLFSIDYVLEGESAAGLPVRGSFSVMVPPPAPTPETSTPVRDPRERAKIRRAMSLLGKPYVTEADLQTLELQGAFDDLAIPPALAPPPPPRYGDMPPHPARRDEPPPDQALPRDSDAPPLTPDVTSP